MRAIILILLSIAGWQAATPAVAAYPEKPIILIVPYSPGGMGTSFGNMVSAALTGSLGQNVLVDYRPGANGSLGAARVAKAAPDGYTLLMAVNSTMAINPNLYPKLPYDPLKDFAAVAMVYTNSNLLYVNAASPIRSVGDLIAAARANPGKLSFGSAGNGASSHLSGEMLKQLAKVDVVHVAYKGNNPALVDLMGGQVDFVFSDTSALPYVASGKLRALAVTGPKRLAAADIPTMEEAGIEGLRGHHLVRPDGAGRHPQRGTRPVEHRSGQDIKFARNTRTDESHRRRTR